MNFSTFGVGVPLSTALPVATPTQFSAGKLTQCVTTANGQVVGVLQGGENGVHYIRPLDANSFATATTQGQNTGQTQTLITFPITMPGAKPGDPQQHVQIQVLNPVQTQISQARSGSYPNYHISSLPLQTFGQGATAFTAAYNPNQEGIQIVDGQNGIAEGMAVVAALQPQDIQLIQAEPDKSNKDVTPVALIKNEMANKENENTEAGTSVTAIPAQYLQNANVQEYLQNMQQHNALPLTNNITTDDQERLILNEVNVADPDKGKKKMKYQKKPPNPKKPKPGQIHLVTAPDGTTLFCCPECHMAYSKKELLEQHLVGHKIERRFICDICGTGLKRKEHLERHKLGHNPERPFVCSVCTKGFKRKEHLNIHLVAHSGKKTEFCGECGKGFYRKDHLRKHARSHITRRAKEQAERNQNILIKEPTTAMQVTIQVPTSQMQIPVQIQVPQHHVQVTANSEEDGNQVSTVVLPTASEGIILPQN